MLPRMSSMAVEQAGTEGQAAPRHVRVGGVKVFDGGLEEATVVLRRRLAEGRGARVATANLDFLALAARDPILSGDLDRSDLVVADGAPVAWMARHAGATSVRRCAGVDLVLALCRESRAGRPLRVLLYGATPDVAAVAAERLTAPDGNGEVAGVMCPPFRPLTQLEQAEEQRQIAALAPDLVLVALGCPRQERLIATYFDNAPTAIWIGVGGTLDFLAGRKRRAPRWLQATGLEWTARLAQDPRRLWRRYLLRDIPFLLRLAPSQLKWGRRAGAG
jgi:N-acetylglucosaminyldiphosphoundecaprenol N-acetyl-beta-D-mannosaminyltransferase